MNQHVASGRQLLGVTLALFTSYTWATIPIILKLLVQWVDVYTLTWFRFQVAGLLLLPLVLRRQGACAGIFRLRGVPLLLLILAIVGLCGNYQAYMSGLRFVSPATGQVVMQISPLLVMLGGLFVFGEVFRRLQWLGFFTLIGGQMLFFYPRYSDLLDLSGNYALGIFLIFLSALLWALYMLMQKQLLVFLAPEAVLGAIYFSGAVFLLPFAAPAAVFALNGIQLLLLLLSSVLTMISYLSFGRALECVEASRVGVIIALMPVLTVLNMGLVTSAFPQAPLAPEQMTPVAWGGAVLVVVGGILGVVGKR